MIGIQRYEYVLIMNNINNYGRIITIREQCKKGDNKRQNTYIWMKYIIKKQDRI